MKKQLPNKEIIFRLVNERRNDVDDHRRGATLSRAKRYLFDRKTKKLTKQYRVRERIPREHLAEMRVVRYKSSDGLEIPAYLTLPKGVAAKNLPPIIIPHGGPWGRDTWGYNSYAQFVANRGYAVLQPNFRASTGFGKKFLDAGNNQWGDKMQDDMTCGVKYLVEQGIADPKRVGHLGRQLRRLCDARGHHVHAGFVRGGGRRSRAVEPDNFARNDSAVLGKFSRRLLQTDGRPEHC